MQNLDKIVKSAITSVIVLTTASTLLQNTQAVAADQQMEKCYGIVKAGMNDCQTSTHSCASSATKDRQPDAFIFLPKGICNRIVGGSLTMPKSNSPQKVG